MTSWSSTREKRIKGVEGKEEQHEGEAQAKLVATT